MSESPARVLVVDDDPDMGELAQRRLKSVGAVDFHEGPDGAPARIEDGNYDVVLLDINMPGTSGLLILDMLKRRGDTEKIVLFSSMDESALAEIARTAGVKHINKSASKDELVALVSSMLE